MFWISLEEKCNGMKRDQNFRVLLDISLALDLEKDMPIN